MARQSPEAAANPQTAMMNKLALYVFPLGVVVGGPFLPIAIILYWVANNIWTFGQQHYVFGKIEKEEEAKKLEEIGTACVECAGARAPSRSAPEGARLPRADGAAPESVEVTESGGSELDGRWRLRRRRSSQAERAQRSGNAHRHGQVLHRDPAPARRTKALTGTDRRE